jgi:hypothetical protein
MDLICQRTALNSKYVLEFVLEHPKYSSDFKVRLGIWILMAARGRG